MEKNDLIPHLFRTEYRKITSVLCKLFGMEHVEIAEDIASDTFLAAFETWSYNGIPENPTAWLYTVAKNKAKNYLSRSAIFEGKVVAQVRSDTEKSLSYDIDLSDQNIKDSQLQMLFALCHPSISIESQIGLSLRILCGFGIDEIANAFITNKETINKRLFRARETLREKKIDITFPVEEEIEKRLQTVVTTLYLLFSEGYYSESQDNVLRKDFCLEAMRLTYMLIENDKTNKPYVNALLSLMCFHASRFEARVNSQNEMVLYDDQDETRWNQELITRGIYFLKESAQGTTLSKYHLEANIAYWYTIKADTLEKWENILQLYNRLLLLEYSPIAALNRTYAFAKVYGNAAAILEAEKLRLENNHFYFALLGELYADVDKVRSRRHFETALVTAKTQTEKLTIQKKLSSL